MNRTTSITLAALLVVATVAVPLAAASVVSRGEAQAEPDADADTEIKPGERFAAAVGVQNAEIEGDVSERAFAARIANAESNRTKAAVVAAGVNETDARMTDLEDRLADLNESRETGAISEGRYRAAVATTVAEMRSLERRAATAETAAAELPPEALAAHGLDEEAIRTLRERAGDLGGPETAAVARSIAGDDVGGSAGTEHGSERPADIPAEPRDDRPPRTDNETNGN
ncbi:hypothetical protein [Natrinema altunense]|uniref:Uncharacterized protein n=1 Tax=Natrinema altunense (strain JCM 12890 / CGMCC 1.3731 / AJ2) TaxID=1227494 RepID=L9ZJM9_NATA2|nr:hypothetical protein [Natrinema altunense]ELY85378.1 hypothetical protein C485_12758 [Natrinema altunense JCM 12890]